MKKIFKVSLAIFAVASMALAASTVMMADSVIIGGKEVKEMLMTVSTVFSNQWGTVRTNR